MTARARLWAAVAVAFGLVSFAGPALAEPGELWESTVEMQVVSEMGSMALPAQTTRFCRPVDSDWSEPPGVPEDGDCEVHDWLMDGQSASWSMRCTSPPMSGSGTMTFDGSGGYAGTMNVTSPQGDMTMKMSGRRVGECDADEPNRQAAEMEADRAAMMAAMCDESVEGMGWYAFEAPGGICAATHKDPFCTRMRTEEGYLALAAQTNEQSPVLSKAGAWCGADPEAIRSELCTRALTSESLEFLGRNCPAESQVLAQRECAGRGYTALAGSKYRNFCSSYARDAMTASETPSSEPQQPPQEEEKKGLLKKGKKLLGGIR